MSLKAARIAAKKVVASVDLERDPHAEKLAARRALAEAKKRAVLGQRTAVEALAETCVAVLPQRPKTVKEWTRLVRTEIIPAFGDRQASELTRVEIRSWADGIAKRPAPYTANRAFEVLRRVYSWSARTICCQRLPLSRSSALHRRSFRPGPFRPGDPGSASRISAVGSPAGRSQAASQGVASLDARTSSRSLPRPWL